MKPAPHTPGPWKYTEVKQEHVVHGPKGDCIAWCNGIRVDNAANARLIAAAPELLDALETLLDITPFAKNPTDANIRLRARDLIRAAKGE